MGSGAEITCARLGFESYQILAAGDDQKNAIIWKITKTKPKLVSANRFISIFDFESHFQFCLLDFAQSLFKCLLHRFRHESRDAVLRNRGWISIRMVTQ